MGLDEELVRLELPLDDEDEVKFDVPVACVRAGLEVELLSFPDPY